MSDLQQTIEIPVKNQRLAATLHLPEAQRRKAAAPVAIYCHGLTGSRMGTAYRAVAVGRKLAAEGIACLRFDFRGCGESDGIFADISADTTRQDLLAAVQSLEGLAGCDPTRVGIFASSFGAWTAALAAEQIPGLQALVFWAPVAWPRKIIERDMPPPAWQLLSKQGWIDHFGLRLGPGFFESLPGADAPSALSGRRLPLAVYHGRGDRHIPFDHGRGYITACEAAGAEVRLTALDTDDHGMRSVPANDAIISGTVDWLTRFLLIQPAAPSQPR